MQMTISVFVAIQAISLEERDQSISQILKVIFLMMYTIGYPVMCTATLFWFRNRLEDIEVRQKIENMYQYISLRRSKAGRFFYAVFLYRRFFFILFPFWLFKYTAQQLQILLLINTAHILFIGYTRPFYANDHMIIELANEFCIMILSYHLFCFFVFKEDAAKLQFMG